MSVNLCVRELMKGVITAIKFSTNILLLTIMLSYTIPILNETKFCIDFLLKSIIIHGTNYIFMLHAVKHFSWNSRKILMKIQNVTLES